MGGCCSKCGVYTTNNHQEKLNTRHTGDTPKLSRLQQRNSFSNGKAPTNGNGVVQSDPGLATPSTEDTCQR